MPELDLVPYAHCLSCDGWSREVTGSRGNRYIVRYEPVEGQMAWTCTCPSYQHRRTECRHIKQVAYEHCGWMQFIDGDEPVVRSVPVPANPDETMTVKECPRCGEGITYMNWGV